MCPTFCRGSSPAQREMNLSLNASKHQRVTGGPSRQYNVSLQHHLDFHFDTVHSIRSSMRSIRAFAATRLIEHS